MNIDRFTEKAQEAILGARNLAQRLGHQTIEPEHILAALLENDNDVAPTMIQKAGADLGALRDRLKKEIGRFPKVSGAGEPRFGPRFNSVVMKAEDESKAMKDDFVAVEHLLLAVAEDSAVARLFKELNLTRDRLLAGMREVRGNQRVTSQNPEGT